MYVFRQVEKHKSRPDSLPSCVGFALANLPLFFWLSSSDPACVHPIMPVRAGGGSRGSTGWGHRWQQVSGSKPLREGRGGVKLSLAVPVFTSVPCWAWMKTYCREQSCAGTFYFSHSKYCVVEVRPNKGNLKTVFMIHNVKTAVCKQPS